MVEAKALVASWRVSMVLNPSRPASNPTCSHTRVASSRLCRKSSVPIALVPVCPPSHYLNQMERTRTGIGHEVGGVSRLAWRQLLPDCGARVVEPVWWRLSGPARSYSQAPKTSATDRFGLSLVVAVLQGGAFEGGRCLPCVGSVGNDVLRDAAREKLGSCVKSLSWWWLQSAREKVQRST